MRIGLTFDLRSEYLALGWAQEDAAEFDSEGTVEAIEQALHELGHETVRIGRCRSLVKALAAGERWDLVFNICEGVNGRGREAEVPALLDCYGIPYTFCDPLTACVTLDKAAAKRIVRDAGFSTPGFMVVESPDDIGALSLSYPLFAKPLAEGTGKGIDSNSVIRDKSQLVETCRKLLTRFRQPVLVEEYLPGREVTVGIIGTGGKARVIGVLEVRLLDSAEKNVYSYQNKEKCEEHVHYRLLESGEFCDEAARLALGCYRVLGCRDAGRLDFRADRNGAPNFIEANPLAGLNPKHSDLPILNELAGHSYRDLIAGIVESAVRRMDEGRPPA